MAYAESGAGHDKNGNNNDDIRSVPSSSLNINIPWPASIYVSDVDFEANGVLRQCGRARKHICEGNIEAALNDARAVCSTIRAYLDDDPTTTNDDVEAITNLFLEGVMEMAETGISILHGMKSFKLMSSATFALAPALIKAAVRVKTAVPQNSISGMVSGGRRKRERRRHNKIKIK